MKNTNKTKKILINKYLERSEGIKFPIYFSYGHIIMYRALINEEPTKQIVSYDVHHNENGEQLGYLHYDAVNGDRYFYTTSNYKISNIIMEYLSSHVKGEFDRQIKSADE